MGVANGVVDLETGQLRPGRPEDRITLASPVAYEPEGRAPRFEQFLDEVFEGDREIIGFIQRALGYSLTGDMSEQVWFVCFGGGANGKSTLLNIARAAADGYAHNLPFSAIDMAARSRIPADLAQLPGKCLVTVA